MSSNPPTENPIILFFRSLIFFIGPFSSTTNEFNGVLVAPGFGERGVEGKIKAIEYDDEEGYEKFEIARRIIKYCDLDNGYSIITIEIISPGQQDYEEHYFRFNNLYFWFCTMVFKISCI
mgnify:CR=1 FL=1